MNWIERLRIALAGGLWVLLVGNPCSGQDGVPGDAVEIPSQARGVNGNSAYEFGDLGTVNLLNGNLSLSIPLGMSYPVGPNLSYQFVLHYNSGAWAYENAECQADADGGGPGGGVTPLRFSVPLPDPLSNAGIGWSLSLGRLLQPSDDPILGASPLRPGRWTYVSPDGSRHGFAAELHPGVGPSDASYTTDGSYLRMRALCPPTGASTCGQREVDFPSGTIKTFANFGTPEEPDWRLTQIRDPFGNVITSTYVGADWMITDSHGRTQVVTFSDESQQRVEQITLQAHNFTAGTATYSLDYAPGLESTISRHRYAGLLANTNCVTPPITEIPNTSSTLSVDLLTGLTRPEGSFFEMSYYDTDVGQFHKSGALRGLRTPVGAHYEWKYGIYPFPQFRPPQAFTLGFPPSRFGAGANWGVVEKRVYQEDEGGTTELGTWSYERIFKNRTNSQTDEISLCYVGNRVTNPAGNKTETYFNTLDFGADRRFDLENASFTLCDPSAPLNSPLLLDPPYLSQRIFEGETLVRSIYLDYENDGPLVSRFERELRVTHRRTVFHDDTDANGVPYQIDEVFSDFDGLGNFRSRTRSSTFPEGTVSNRVFTNYNSVRSHPDPPAAGGEQLIPEATEPWLLGDYTYREVSQGADRSLERFCFDESTGALLGSRSVKDQSISLEDGPEDALTLFTLDGQGFSADITFYGGDASGSPLPGGDVCETTAVAAYRISQTHNRGVLETSFFLACDGSPVSRRVKNRIDPTGLLTNTDDEADIRTVFRYDLEGRLVCSARTGEVESWNQYHFPVSAVDSAELEAFSCPSSTQPCAVPCAAPSYLTHSRVFFDGLGRRILEKRRIPLEGGDSWVERLKTYDLSGRLARESVWVPEGVAALPVAAEAEPTASDTPHRWFRDYDRFGRARKVENPDRSFSTFSFKGDREKVSMIAIGQGAVASEHIEIRDGHGRLVRVSEQSAGNAAQIHTTYRYDHEGRLERVCANDNNTLPADCPASGAQRRIFDYDGRGWLSQENHPELGATAGGSVDYSYDAMGIVVLRDAPGTSSDLVHVYDRAGRLTQVCTDGNLNRVCSDPGDRLLKELFYGREVNGAIRNKGKLVMAKRHNWVRTSDSLNVDSDVVVTENFGYTQRSGKLSEYRVRASGGPSFQYQILAYDDLGNPKDLRYPECANGSCEIGGGRTVTNLYSQGLLSQVSGYASKVFYHPSGQLAGIEHANGISDLRTLDPLGWRLGSISVVTQAGSPIWSTGNYGYDASGNILSIGQETFDYDRVGRLVASSVKLPDGTFVTQGLSYDIFGNLTSIDTTDHGMVSLAPSPASNRLSGAGYDARGNVTNATIDGTGLTLTYDPFDRMKSSTESGGASNSFLYTASDERFAVLNPGLGDEIYTIRGPANEVLTRARRFSSGSLVRQKDYIYASGTLVAVEGAAGQRHVHVDHLGTTRRVTNDSSPAQIVEATTLYPFGGYTDLPAEGSEELLFTGHERDARSTNADAALDYMHARYYTSYLGRFLSIDPVLGEASVPQSWNRYAYVLNNPLRLVDPSGESSGDAEFSPDTAGVAVLPQDEEQLTEERLSAEQQDLLAQSLLAGSLPSALSAVLDFVVTFSEFAAAEKVAIGSLESTAFLEKMGFSRFNTPLHNGARQAGFNAAMFKRGFTGKEVVEGVVRRGSMSQTEVRFLKAGRFVRAAAGAMARGAARAARFSIVFDPRLMGVHPDQLDQFRPSGPN